jgi:hypothetical protein
MAAVHPPPIPSEVRVFLVGGSSMPSVFRSFVLFGVAAGAAVGAAPAPEDAPVTVAVAGRGNAHVSIAASHALVVAAWGASRDGAADVYAAVSRDGGRSFGGPVRVNAAPGEAALGGERAPRVAIATRPGGPAIAVLWTAKAPARASAPSGAQPAGPVIRLAESIDLGRTFVAPIDLSGRDAPGIRGWAALAAGADGAWYAAWLDGRADAAKKAAAASAGTPAASEAAAGGHHHHGGSTGTGPLQEVYYRVVGRDGQTGEALGATGVCFCCKTAILGPGAAETGRPGARDMILAWRHIFPNSERDIALSVLDPASGRPGRMVRVSDDRWQLQGCPDDGPGLAASGSGTVHVVWPTLAEAGAPAGGPEKAIYHARTTDGRTCTPRRRLDAPGSGAAHPVVAALASGPAVALWDEVADGVRRVVAQPIREPATPIVLGPGVYPSVAALDDAFVVAWTVGSGDAAVVRVQRLATRMNGGL